MTSRDSKFDNEGYEPISLEDEPCLSNSLSKYLQQPSWMQNTAIRCTIYAIAACFLVLTGVSIGSYRHRPIKDDSGLRIFENVRFETGRKTFNGSFFHRSQYSGPPSPEMDKAWAHFADTGSPFMPHYPAFIAVSESDAQMSTGHSLDTAVWWNTPKAKGYLASLEVFHHLHCLNYIRKFIHLDYYKITDPEWAGKKLLREHADHCVYMLRELLMCKSDTGLITYHWVKGYLVPAPDFSTSHMCRDPEEVPRWTRDNEVHLTRNVMKEGQVDELPEIF